jgi:heme/copper-type cytochrome/quinol oxidase subunit 4
MDKTQLVTIVITAVIAVLAKELTMWVVRLIKSMSVLKTIAAKVKTLFSKNNLLIVMDIAMLAFYVFLLVFFTRNDSPPSRIEILLMIFCVLVVIFMCGRLIWRFAWARVKKMSDEQSTKEL